MRVRIAGALTTRRVPVSFRYEGPVVGGEKRHAVQVVPELSLRLSPEMLPVPLAAPRPLELRAFVRSFAPRAGEGTVRLEAPAGWRVAPPAAPLHFAYEGEEAAAHFTLTPPRAGLAAGPLVVRAVAARDGRESRESLQVVEYPHVERRPLLRPAETRLVVLPVRTSPGASVGYVMGSGDAIADAIRQLGVPVTLLSAEDLAFADLGRFRTIVTGIRAYETREDLRAAHGRLMRWVEGGGHLVVQYNRDAFNRVSPAGPPGPGGASPYVPYPAVVTSERISDETTPVRVLAPRHPLLTTPQPHRGQRLGGLGAGARHPAPRRARCALRRAARRDRSLPQQPRREEGPARRRGGRAGHVDLRRARSLSGGAGRRPRRLAAAREPGQPRRLRSAANESVAETRAAARQP